MLALVAVELVPEVVRSGRRWAGAIGFATGGAAMLWLSLALGV
jgi:hypothetical protein